MSQRVPAPPAVSSPPVSHHGIRAWAVRRLRAEAGNWRLLLVRTLTSGVAVVVTVFVVPGLSFQHWRDGEFVLVGIVFGLLTALVKPALQFVALRYIVVSYGLVLVLVNTVLLWLLSVLLGHLIHARDLLAALLGGLVVGVIGTLLDAIAGATPPILDRPSEPEEHR
jgi:putative membrane protein